MPHLKIKKELAEVESPSATRLIEYLIQHALLLRASDIHIDPIENSLRIRFRIDGVLIDAHDFPKKIHLEMVSRVKILAQLRIDEHAHVQDGRFRYEHVDVRVSIMPTYYGENTVLRLLRDIGEDFSLETLGFSSSDREKIKYALSRHFGMTLVTGPTGSGKTTTLYTLLKILNTKEVSIVTLEDPIEYAISGVRQMHINQKNGLTFATGLRGILRQDPDIIMVGEIRDVETASIAVNSALTGHVLLSTLHTNDASSALPRLLDMQVEPYLLASTITLVIGQRLLRKICDACKMEEKLLPEIQKNLETLFGEKIPKSVFYKGVGCESCGGSGYVGRIGVYEILPMHPAIHDALIRKAPAREIKTIAVSLGMKTMQKDAFEKAKDGLTTISEIIRTLHE